MSALGWAAYAVVAFTSATYLLAWVEGMSPREFTAALRESMSRGGGDAS